MPKKQIAAILLSILCLLPLTFIGGCLGGSFFYRTRSDDDLLSSSNLHTIYVLTGCALGFIGGVVIIWANGRAMDSTSHR